MLHLLVKSAEHLGGITAEERIATQPAHHVGGSKTAPDHISDHDAQPTGRKGGYVVPVTADGGGSNGSRLRLWKTQLAQLAAETGLEIIVCHLPPDTSK